MVQLNYNNNFKHFIKTIMQKLMLQIDGWNNGLYYISKKYNDNIHTKHLKILPEHKLLDFWNSPTLACADILDITAAEKLGCCH